jgi:GH24 family phage-related lysozyme (muramidase)
MEGFEANLYNDATGNCTVGYGHLVHSGGCSGASSEEQFKDGISKDEATTLFTEDLSESEKSVSSNSTENLTQAEYDSLVSFTYNVGNYAFETSDLLEKLNKKDFSSIPNELNRWTKGYDKDGNLVDIPGLVRRREAEGNLFSRGTYAKW